MQQFSGNVAKIFTIIVIAISGISCTGGSSGSGGGYTRLPNILGPSSSQKPVEKPAVSQNTLTKEPITLNENSPANILDEIAATVKSKAVRNDISSTDATSFSSYIGEDLYIPLKESEISFKTVSSPVSDGFNLTKVNTNLLFKTVYEGRFIVDITGEEETLSRSITIDSLCKYDIKEDQLYSLVRNAYTSNDLKKIKDASDLYKMIFPNTTNLKSVLMMALETAGNAKNANIVGKEYKDLVKGKMLNESDRSIVAKALADSNIGELDIDKSLLAFSPSDKETNISVANIIIKKNLSTKDEIKYLEKIYQEYPEDKIGNYIGKWYTRNGDPTLGNQYLAGNKSGISAEALQTMTPGAIDPIKEAANKNYSDFKEAYTAGESSFKNRNYSTALSQFQKASELNKNYAEIGNVYLYMGQCNYNLNKYKNAMDNYKKALSYEKNADNQAQIYYNMGVASDKLGNISDCKNYMTYIKQKFPNSTWSSKGEEYLAKFN